MDDLNVLKIEDKCSVKRRKQIFPTKTYLENSKQNSMVKSKNDALRGTHRKEDIIDTIKRIMVKKIITINDIHYIAHYLNSLEDLVNYIKTNHENYRDLLYEIAFCIKGIFYNKNDIIFKYGDKGENFYIILEGSVSVIKPKEVRVEISEEEYLLYLAKCKKYEEIDIVHQCLNYNKSIFNIDDEWMSWLKSNEKTINANIILKIKRKSEFFKELNNNLLNENKKISISPEEYIKRIEVVKLTDIERKEKLVTVFQYHKIIVKNTGGKFGELSSEKNNLKRTATIVTESDCLLGILDQDSYKQCLKQLNDKIIKKAVDFFLSSKLFYGFNRMLFEIKMYHLFVHKNIDRFDRIINEGEEPRYIYIIKKGEFEVTGRLNLLEFGQYVYYFGKVKMNNKFEDLMEKEKIENDAKFKKYISQKHLVKISIAKTGDVLGLDDMIYNDKYAFSAECVTAQTEIFILDKKNFEFILQNYKEIRKNYQNFLNTKIDYLVQRLISMKETKVNIFNYKHDKNLNRKPFTKAQETLQNIHKSFSPHIGINSSMLSPDNNINKLKVNKSISITNKDKNKSTDNLNKVKCAPNILKNIQKSNGIQIKLFSFLKNEDFPTKIQKRQFENNSINFDNQTSVYNSITTKSYSSESKFSLENNETKEIIYKGDAYLKQTIRLRTASVKNKLSSNNFLLRLKNFMDKKKTTCNKSTSVNFKDLKLGSIENSHEVSEKQIRNVYSQINLSPGKKDSCISKLNLYNDNIPRLRSGLLMNFDFSLSKDQCKMSTLKQYKDNSNIKLKVKNVQDEVTLSPVNDKRPNPVNIFKERQSQSRIKRYKRPTKSISDNSNLDDVLKHYKLF